MSIIITPSPEEVKVAISSAVDRAHSLGYEDGKEDGYKQGFSEGATSNDEEVYEGGYNAGYADGSQVVDEALQDKYEEGYEDGYDDGKSSMIDESKIIEKTASGTGIVALDDVSEIPHDISVQLSGDNVGGKQVKVCGNLCDFDTLTFTHSKSLQFRNQLPAGKLSISALVTTTATTDTCVLGIVDINGNATYPTIRKTINGTRSITTFTASAPIRAMTFYSGADSDSSKGQIATFEDIMISYEMQILAYSPYTEPLTYTSNIDGKIEGISSISPYMAFVCDGADMSVSYRADWGIVTEREKQWNAFSINGIRTNFQYAFANGWSDETFHPFTDVNMSGNASYAFWGCRIVDLVQCFKKYGTKLNTSQATNMQLFAYGTRTRFLPEISFEGITSAANVNNVFSSSYITEIEKVVFKEDGTTPIGNMFNNATGLKEVRIGGVIGQSVNFGVCPLSRESMTNIFEHFSTTASGVTATFKKSAVESAFTTAEWDELVATRPNLTIVKA